MRAAAALIAALLAGSACAATPDPYAARIARILRATPLIDGHNDWAEVLREREGQGRWTLDLRAGLDKRSIPYNTDIVRLRAGQVGGQFWSVYVSADLPEPEQVRQTLEQIDLVKQIVARYSETFALARTAADVRRIHRTGRIASLIGVEGGGQIGSSLSVLRAYHALGAGYLTLAHFKTIAWADSATDDPKHGGLTPFGEAVVRELNRLGMLVDLAHVSEDTMRDALRVSRAPVIFSHSSARALDDHPRNVSDDVLRLVAANGGIVMANYAVSYVSDALRVWGATAPDYAKLYPGQPARVKAASLAWLADHPPPKATLSQVADHIEHIANVAGIDHVGIGSDFDGVSNKLPEGLQDVSTYPALLAELMRRGWSDRDIAKLAGENILRVMTQAEAVATSLKTEPPANDAVEQAAAPGDRPR